MRKSIRGLAFFLFAFPATLLLGQGSVAGSITGIVMDPQGAVISGAVVTVTGPALLTPKTQKSIEGGAYLVEQLPPGEYTVTSNLPGFKTFQQRES